MIGVYKFAAVKEKIQDLIAQGLYDDFEAAGGDKEARLLEIEAGFVEILNARLG